MVMRKFNYDDDVYAVDAVQNNTLLIKDRDLGSVELRIIKKIFDEEDCRRIKFSNCIFSNLHFEDYTLPKSVMFDTCDFYGKTTFINCKNPYQLNFSGSTFHNETRFENCEIANEMNFSKIQTKPSCPFYFKNNKLAEGKEWVNISFEKAHFADEAVFNYLKGFVLMFSDVKFDEKFYFTGTEFFEKSMFCDVQFPSNTTPEIKVCFQTLYKALLSSSFDTEAETIKEHMKSFDKIMAVTPVSQEVPEKRIFSNEEAAKYIGVKPATLDKWRSLGKDAKHQPIPLTGRPVRYTKESLDTYLQECKN